MTVAIYVASQSDAKCLIPWGVRFAQADHTDLLIVCPRKSKGKQGWDPLHLSEKDDSQLFRAVFDILEAQDSEKVVLKERIAEGTESSDLHRVAIETREMVAPNPEEAFVEAIGNLEIWTLLLRGHETKKASHPDNMHWAQRLFLNAPCQVAIVRGLPPGPETPMNIVIACHDASSLNDSLAIKRACQLAKISDNGAVQLVYVRPDDDEVARQVGENHLQQLAKGVPQKGIPFTTRVELADSFSDGIQRLPLDQFHLLISGTRDRKTIRALERGVAKNQHNSSIAIMAIRESVPLTDRMWSRFKQKVRTIVPQMDRDQRVSLVDRLQESSKFNFDFVALISLSTLIAALGLARNSAAVVIGAMLVAPLMTPLVAMGFALVQGNGKLIRDALKSVILGFTVALAIGACVGLILQLIAPHLPISSQMQDRDLPNLLDLVVALASGVAGAYAMSRKNLNSAIPGVAIAAALVPPIATTGLALTMGDLALSGGASLLFFTNIVAIVLGTAMTFWAVGISTRVINNRPIQVWPRYWFIGFVVLSFLLAAVMSIMNPVDPVP